MSLQIISAQWVIPVEPANLVLNDHAVVIEGTRIKALLPSAEVRKQFPHAPEMALENHVLIPGLINLHTHAAMSLMRSMGDDLALMPWLTQHIWPAEKQHLSDEFVAAGTTLACAEMLRGGTTCFADMYFFEEAVARVAQQSGMRAVLGGAILEFPTAYAPDAEAGIEKCLALHDVCAGDPLLKVALAPHAPYTVSDATFKRIATLADEIDALILLHLHETQDEITQSEKDYGCRPVTRLERLGLITPNLIAAHCVHLTPLEIEIFANTGAHVAHCPTSNLKLACGVAPVAAMLQAGVNVGVGTDGAASNNRLDMLAEIRLAALLQKGITGDATALPAHTALRMATLNAARALGWDHEIGSLLPGKACDMVALDFSAPETQPCFDAASQLIHAAGREQVSHAWVQGELLLNNRQLTHLDIAEVRANASVWRDRLLHPPA